MAQIPGSDGFGNVTARPRRFNEAQVPRDAFGGGVGQALAAVGEDMQRQQVAGEREAMAQQMEIERQKEAVNAQLNQDVRDSIAERKAANLAKASQLRLQVETDLDDLGDEFADGIKTGQIDKTKAPTEWARVTKERLTASLKDAPEEHRAALQSTLDSKLTSITRTKIAKGVRTRDMEDTRAGVEATLEHAQRLYSTDPKAAVKLADTTLSQLGSFAGWGADDIQKKRQGFLENAEYTAAATLIDNARGDAKKLTEAAKAVDNFANLDPEKKRALKDKAFDQGLRIQEVQARKSETAARQYEAGLKRAESAFTAAQALSDKGLLTDTQRDIYGQQMRGTPFAASFRTLMENQAATGVLTMQPPAKLQAEIDALRADIRANGISEAKQKRLQQVESVQRGQSSDIKDDPLRAYTSRYLTTPAPALDMTNIATVTQSLAQRAQIAERASVLWDKKDVSPLFKEEAERVGDMLQALPEKERGQAIAMISKTLGKNAARGMATQLNEKDRPMALAFASGDANLAGLMLRGDRALADKTVLKDDKAVTGWKSTIATEMEGLFSSPQTAQSVMDSAYLVTAAKAAELGGAAGPSDIRSALQSVLGGKIVEQGQGRIVIPEGRTQRELTQRLKSYTVDDITMQTPDGKVRAGGVEMDAKTLVERLPGATLQTLAPGRYVILVPRVQGGKPDTYVTATDGRPIVVGFEK